LRERVRVGPRISAPRNLAAFGDPRTANSLPRSPSARRATRSRNCAHILKRRWPTELRESRNSDAGVRALISDFEFQANARSRPPAAESPFETHFGQPPTLDWATRWAATRKLSKNFLASHLMSGQRIASRQDAVDLAASGGALHSPSTGGLLDYRR